MVYHKKNLVFRQSDINKNKAELLNNNIGIYDENHRLIKAAIWGPVGAESVLTQLFPREVSLFLDQMDVVKARGEAIRFADILKSYDVDVFIVRDELAKLIPKKPLRKKEIRDKLIAKARDIYNRYNIEFSQYEEMIEILLQEDINRYGEEIALNLNNVLSLNPKLPLGNCIFARDQANVLMSKRIRSNMAKPIRSKEVSLYEKVYQNIGLINPIIIPQGQTFEGGDAYIHDGIIYIGVGERTTLEAALTIYEGLKDELKKKQFRFALVVDTNDYQQTFEDKMNFMHLDTFSTPLGHKKMLICEEEARRRRVYFVENGKVVDHGQTFIDHLQEEGNELLIISPDEQQTFGANLLSLDDKTVFVPLDINTYTIKSLVNIGKQVINLDLKESTKGWGAAHCMVFQIKRC